MQWKVAKVGDASIISGGNFNGEILCTSTLIYVVHAGALEQAMQLAESQGVLSSSDEVHMGNSNSNSKHRGSEGRPAKAIAKSQAKGNAQSNRRQESLPQVTACDVTKTGRCWILAAVIVFLIFSFGGASICKCKETRCFVGGPKLAGHCFVWQRVTEHVILALHVV